MKQPQNEGYIEQVRSTKHFDQLCAGSFYMSTPGLIMTHKSKCVLPPSYKHQTPEEHQSEAHHSSTAEPQEDETNGEPGIWVKSGPASETVRLTPAAADNQAVEHLPGRDKITCSYCNKHFNYRSQLIIHERVHTRERPFVCKQCGKGFSQINSLTKHQLSNKACEGQHKCKECGKVFRHAQSLTNHGASAHSFGKRLACQTRGKTLHTKNALLAHTSTHERTFRCEICGKSFGKKQILKSHQFTHTGERPFVCNYCGKSFAFLCNLKTHERVHTGEKPFGCERCGRRFTQKHSLRNHGASVHGFFKRTHERTFRCEICGKSFGTKQILKSHQFTHTGERPFVCNYCGKSFAFLCNLKTHERVHTGENFKVSSHL
uniref:C2H2-type domain-containing protein n=1 Tax=Esox lucius TaxID=8010 RepID=A0AAY5L6U7_ESOLU